MQRVGRLRRDAPAPAVQVNSRTDPVAGFGHRRQPPSHGRGLCCSSAFSAEALVKFVDDAVQLFLQPQQVPLASLQTLELGKHRQGRLPVVLSRQVMTRGVEPAALSCGHVLNEAPRTPEARERGLLAFLCPSGVDK